MPLTLVPPKAGRTPNYHIRGSYLGISVNRSAKTPVKDIAKRIKRRIEEEIEQGIYKPQAATEDVPVTFLAAAVACMKAGGERDFPAQSSSKRACIPSATRRSSGSLRATSITSPESCIRTPRRRPKPASLTPIASVLHRAGDQRKFKRPKGWRGSRAFSKLEPEEAFALLEAAEHIDREFGLLCYMLLYTGRRISETLNATLGDLNLDRSVVYLRATKNGEAVEVHLPPIVLQKFRAMTPRPFREGSAGRSQTDAGVAFLKRDPDQRIFRFHYSSYLLTPRRRNEEGRAQISATSVRLPLVLSHLRHLDAPLRQSRHVRPGPHQSLERSALGGRLRAYGGRQRSPHGGHPADPRQSVQFACITGLTRIKSLNVNSPVPSHGRGRRFNPYSAHHPSSRRSRLFAFSAARTPPA